MKHRISKIILTVLLDIIGIGVGLCIFALFHHVLPQKYQSDTAGLVFTRPVSSTPTPGGEGSLVNQIGTEDGTLTPVEEGPTPTPLDMGDFGMRFPEVFTDGEIITTDTTYKSENISVTTTTYSSENLTYYVQDIFIKNMENLKTAFAEDTYGKSISQWPLAIAVDHSAVASINGDYYGIHEDGIVIRNGYVYRTEVDDNAEVCALFWDGRMEVYPAYEVDADQLVEDGCYQTWSFGPGLLDENGKAKTDFSGKIAKAHPRSAIGYYEPGHYCFVAVDGREENGSDGATMKKLASIMEELGCKAAYNLDGGRSSAMTFGDELVNTPCHGGREDTDIIYIGE